MGVASPRLKRTIGLRTIVSASAGLTFASSTFLAVVQIGCGLSGDSSWIPILIAGLLCALAAAAFSELNGMWPSVNGLRLYVLRAFGERASLVISLTYMSVVALVVGTEAYVLSHVLSFALPSVPPLAWIFVMLTAATFFNYKGIRIAGAFQDIVTYTVVASIVIMSIAALERGGFHIPHPLQTGGGLSVFTVTGLAIFLFVGFEWVTPLADEARAPKMISTGMFIALGMLTIVYALLAESMFAGLQGVGRDVLFGTKAHRNPIPHLVFARNALGSVGLIAMIITSLLMSITTFNAGLMSVSRFLYGMARDGVLPKRLGILSQRSGSPAAAITAVYIIALIVSAIVYATQRFVLLVNVAAATESFAYAIAAASVIALRIKDKDRPRPFRMTGGYALPALTVLAFAGVGAGVFAQSGADYWGAGLLLIGVGLCWGAYIHFSVMPRLEAQRISAQKKSRRPSRRPAEAESAEKIVIPQSGNDEASFSEP